MDLPKLKNTTNIALMGCGRICKKHAEAIVAAPGIRLTGVVIRRLKERMISPRGMMLEGTVL